MSLSERSTSRGYAERAGPPQPDRPARSGTTVRRRLYRSSNTTGTACRNRAQRGQRISLPGPIRPDPSCCSGNEAVAKMCPSAQRTTVRSMESIKSLPQQALDEKATLGDERDATPGGAPTPTLRPQLPPTAPASTIRPQQKGPTAQTPGTCDGVQYGTADAAQVACFAGVV